MKKSKNPIKIRKKVNGKVKFPFKVKIFFAGEFKLNIDATSFAILSLNKIQNLIDFQIFEETEEFLNVNEESFAISFDDYIKNKKLLEKNSLYIYITENEIMDNWFHATSSPFSIITTKDWKKSYSPPSYLEYIINSIADCLIHSIYVTFV